MVLIEFMVVDELLVCEQTELVTVEADELCSRCRPDIQKDIDAVNDDCFQCRAAAARTLQT